MSEKESAIRVKLKRHHVRANTRCQNNISRERTVKIVKELLQNCGAAPQKLKNIFENRSSKRLTCAGSISNSRVTQHSYSTSYKYIDIPQISFKHSVSSLVVNSNTLHREIIRKNLNKRCGMYETLVGYEGVNRMIYNFGCHLVAVFKDYLISDDSDDFVCRICDLDIAYVKLPILIDYHNKNRVSPCYLGFGMKDIFVKKERRKAKIEYMRKLVRMNSEQEEQNIFKSTFINSILKDDIQKSYSKITYIEPSIEHKDLDELLQQLNKVVSTRNEQQIVSKKEQLNRCRHKPSNSTAILRSCDNNSVQQSLVSTRRCGLLKVIKRVRSLKDRLNPSARSIRINYRKIIPSNSLPKIESSSRNTRAVTKNRNFTKSNTQNIENMKEIHLVKAHKVVHRLPKVRFNIKI